MNLSKGARVRVVGVGVGSGSSGWVIVYRYWVSSGGVDGFDGVVCSIVVVVSYWEGRERKRKRDEMEREQNRKREEKEEGGENE